MGAPALPPSLGAPDAGARFAGVQREVVVPNPAVGADWSYVVGGGTLQRIMCGYMVLTTSAVVANRIPLFALENADGNRVFTMALPGTIPNNSIWRISLAPGDLSEHFATTGITIFRFPSFWLPAGYRLRVSTISLDPGDQWSLIRMVVEEMDIGPYGEQFGTERASGN